MITNISVSNQKGVVGILAVMGFITFSLSVLGSFSYYYRQSQRMIMQELYAKQGFLLAESALQWGMALHWQLSPHYLNRWQCQTFSADPKMKSCLLLITQEHALLQGQVISLKNYKISHYQWVNLSGKEYSVIKRNQNGWLDFCPLKYQKCIG